MTGIELLRDRESTMRLSGLTWAEEMADDLKSIADKIEREHAEDCFKMGERAAEDAEAVAWVRDHGGLADVKRHWTLGVEASTACCVEVTDDASLTSCLHVLGCLTEYDVPLAHAVVAELWPDGRPDECDNDRVMGELRRRLVPEGIEWLVEAWPRFEDEAPVRFGEEAIGFSHKPPFVVDHVTLFDGGEVTVCAEADHDSGKVENFIRVLPGERVKRPAPKVLDADGVEIREKCDVWWICEGDDRGVHAERLRVEAICPNGLVECSPYNGGTWVHLEPSELYVNKPVPASDGKPLREGETVYHTKSWMDNEPRVIERLEPLGDVTRVWFGNGNYEWSENLTHERPESKCRDCAHWQKDPTANNMGVCWFYYHEHEGQDCYAARRGDIGACEEFMPSASGLEGDA